MTLARPQRLISRLKCYIFTRAQSSTSLHVQYRARHALTPSMLTFWISILIGKHRKTQYRSVCEPWPYADPCKTHRVGGDGLRYTITSRPRPTHTIKYPRAHPSCTIFSLDFFIDIMRASSACSTWNTLSLVCTARFFPPRDWSHLYNGSAAR